MNKLKRQIRLRMRQTGESYSTARMRILEERAKLSKISQLASQIKEANPFQSLEIAKEINTIIDSIPEPNA